MRRLAGIAAVLVIGGCEVVENPRAPATSERVAPAAPIFNRAWRTADADAAPGSVRVFLEDGTLLMTSCAEVYRLARWEVLPDGRLSWDEDGARVEAAVLSQAADTLVLELDLGADRIEQRYTTAAAPWTCAEPPR